MASEGEALGMSVSRSGFVDLEPAMAQTTDR
jgi:hypothetical protein